MNPLPPPDARFTNRLAGEKSPYLLQHAHNPVDWFPWGDEAFRLAREQDRPIFLSVGYSACHWCHVMERESFENEATARLINERFIPVKVDREERPDVDEVYMTAVQMMTGSGGWPMSVFLTPDGRPFYGGTYFPPESRHGRVGFPSLVVQLSEAWQTRRSEIEEVANTLTTDLQAATRQSPIAVSAGTVEPDTLLAAAVTDMAARFDAATGGFGGAPKFPPHHALRLLTTAARRGDVKAREMLETTLDRMALGGIYDHIGGGFHRYATDAVWLLPHFEKMLYDNALLARVYADGYELTGRAGYARIARETCDWVLRDMTDEPGGGFHAALDADSEGEEGKFYVWTLTEVRQALGDEASAAFALRYHIGPQGNFRDEATGRATGTNIPYLGLGPSGPPLPDVLDGPTESARAALLARRNGRVPPGKDDKVITAWNGLMIGALAFVGAALKEPRFLDAARRAAEFCLTTLRPEGELVRRYAKGDAGLPAFLDDYAFLADGLLDLYEATNDARWLSEARSLAETMRERFWDADDSGFFYAADGHETLIARTKDLFDGALPSANGVAVRVMTRLGLLPGGESNRESARITLTAYRGLLERAPQGTPTLILAALDAFASPSGTEAHPAPPVWLRAQGTMSLSLSPGADAEVRFTLVVAPEFHVSAVQGSVVATLSTDAPAAVGPVQYPQPAQWESGGEVIPAYLGPVPFVVPLKVAAGAAPGDYHVTLTLRVQVCTESECLAPAEHTARVALAVTDGSVWESNPPGTA